MRARCCESSGAWHITGTPAFSAIAGSDTVDYPWNTVGLAGDATARWYEFDVSSGVPVLKQQGNVRPGPGVSTYYPSIAINAAGDIGLTYMQSSADEFVSMYVTGQKAGGPAGSMGVASLVKGDQEVVGGVVVARAGATLDPEQVLAWCRAEMANYKAPRYVEVLTELPLNAMGKVTKFELRDRGRAMVAEGLHP